MPGQPDLESIVIDNGSMAVELLAMGASIRSIRLAGIARSVALGAADRAFYGPDNKAFLGATIGRNANRVAHGRLPVGGVVHALSINQPPHQLHGGTTGFWSRLWTVEHHSDTACAMRLVSADGEDGYPGTAEVTATFELVGPSTLSIAYRGYVDAPSALNLTSHLYFDLSGTGGTQDHHLTVEAGHYLPVDASLIPTGTALGVEGTLFDFRRPKPLGEGPPLLDHNFCLGETRVAEPRVAARLASRSSGLALTIETTECGLQVYDGGQFDGTIEGLDGQPIGRHGGIALEPQAWPDWPNQPGFPGALIGPGETYTHRSLYRFERD